MSGFLDLQLKPYQQTLMTRAISLIPALTVALISSNSFDDVDEWLNVQQSVQLPFALLPLLFMNCNTRVMGIFALSFKWRIFFYTASAGVIAVNVYLIYDTIIGLNSDNGLKTTLIVVSLVFYLGACIWLVWDFYSRKYDANKYGYDPSTSSMNVKSLINDDNNGGFNEGTNERDNTATINDSNKVDIN